MQAGELDQRSQSKTVTDSRIGQVKGKYCCYELMNSGVATERQARFESVYASF